MDSSVALEILGGAKDSEPNYFEDDVFFDNIVGGEEFNYDSPAEYSDGDELDMFNHDFPEDIIERFGGREFNQEIVDADEILDAVFETEDNISVMSDVEGGADELNDDNISVMSEIEGGVEKSRTDNANEQPDEGTPDKNEDFDGDLSDNISVVSDDDMDAKDYQPDDDQSDNISVVSEDGESLLSKMTNELLVQKLPVIFPKEKEI